LENGWESVCSSLLFSGLPRLYGSGKKLQECSPTFLALLLPLGYFTLPSIHALAKVRTTKRLNTTELTRTLNRFEDGEGEGDGSLLLRFVTLAAYCKIVFE